MITFFHFGSNVRKSVVITMDNISKNNKTSRKARREKYCVLVEKFENFIFVALHFKVFADLRDIKISA